MKKPDPDRVLEGLGITSACKLGNVLLPGIRGHLQQGHGVAETVKHYAANPVVQKRMQDTEWMA